MCTCYVNVRLLIWLRHIFFLTGACARESVRMPLVCFIFLSLSHAHTKNLPSCVCHFWKCPFCFICDICMLVRWWWSCCSFYDFIFYLKKRKRKKKSFYTLHPTHNQICFVLKVTVCTVIRSHSGVVWTYSFTSIQMHRYNYYVHII